MRVDLGLRIPQTYLEKGREGCGLSSPAERRHAAAMAKVIVSTRVGAEGLEFVDGEERQDGRATFHLALA